MVDNKNVNKELLNLLAANDENEVKNVEDKLGIKFCTDDYSHIYVMEEKKENSKQYFGLKSIGHGSRRIIIVSDDQIQRCIICGKQQVVSKIKGLK